MEFFEKVTKVQNELKAPKSQKNNFGNYNYRSCEDIVESVKPLLRENGLFLNITDEVVLIGDRFYIKATASLGDGMNQISAVGYAREPKDKKGMDESQITGSTSSYARKYALNGLLAIDDTKDADTNEYREQTSKYTEKAKTSNVETKKAENKGLSKDTLEECNALNIKLENLAVYFGKKSAEELTEEEVKSAIAKKKEKLGIK